MASTTIPLAGDMIFLLKSNAVPAVLNEINLKLTLPETLILDSQVDVLFPPPQAVIPSIKITM